PSARPTPLFRAAPCVDRFGRRVLRSRPRRSGRQQAAVGEDRGTPPRPNYTGTDLMTFLDIEQGVIDAIKTASRRPIEPTLASALVADLGFDSLQVLDVIAELEGRFDISIPLDEVPAARTVAQIVAQVTRLVAERGAAK